MTTRPLLLAQPTPVARVTLGPNAQQGGCVAAPAARPGEVQWGQANGCVFRFDPQAAPQHIGVGLAPPAARRILPLPHRNAVAVRAARRSGRSSRVAMAVGDEADFDTDVDDNADDASIEAAGSAQGAGSRSGGDQGGHDGQGASGGGGGDGGGAGPDSAKASASTGAWLPPEMAEGPTASAFGKNRSVSPMWLALTSNESSLPLRQRALAAMGAAEPTLRCGEALSHVRAALIEAVNSGAFVPKVDPASPDQNCLLPLLLLRASRPMRSAQHAQAGARAAAMLSMAERLRRAPIHPLERVTAR